MTRRAKPVIHGRDHAPDGPDPVPGVVTIADEGTTLPTEPVLNFTGTGVTAADNPATNSIDVTIAGGAGIQYDTDNEGDWLDIGTTGRDADGYGTRFHDDSAAAGISVGIQATGGTAAITGLDVAASNTGSATVTGIRAQATGTTPIAVRANVSNGWGFYADVTSGNGIQVDTTSNGVVVNLTSGSGFAVYVTVGGVAVFAVDSAGIVHMRSAPVIGPF